MSGSSAPAAPNVANELSDSISALNSNSGGLVSAEQSIAPQLSQLSAQNNINTANTLASSYFGSTGIDNMAEVQGESMGNSYLANQTGQLNSYLNPISSALNNSNPYATPLQSVANQYVGAGENPVMSSLTNLQANFGSSINPQLNDLSASSMLGQGALSGGMASSAVLPGNQGPGSLSAGTQQLVDTTSQQLSLGGNISPEEQDMVSQASRAADSARGIFNSNASASNELLNLDQYSQARLAARESAAGSAQGIANTQLQNNVTNQQAALTGASSIFNTGNQTALQAITSGGALNLQGLAQASSTQQAGLSQQFNYNNSGLNQLAYLASLGQTNSSSALNFINGSTTTGSQMGLGLLSGMNNVQANPNPTVFNSLGLFPAATDSANTAYNGQFASQEQNAQGNNEMMGAGIAAGATIIGAVAL